MPKIAIFSDIHGNILALEKVVEDLKSRQVDNVVNLGDHVSGPLWPKETIQFLMAQDWLQIAGNQDWELVNQHPQDHGLSNHYAFQQLDSDQLKWISALPASMVLQEEALLIHGTPSNNSAYLLDTIEHGRARLATSNEIVKRLDGTKSRVVLCGHSHIPRVVELSSGMLIINPGSVGLPAYEDETPEMHIMETGSPHARYAIMSRVDGHWHVELISIPYEHEKAAAQARKNSRFDWETGLRYGFMQKNKAG